MPGSLSHPAMIVSPIVTFSVLTSTSATLQKMKKRKIGREVIFLKEINYPESTDVFSIASDRFGVIF